MEAILNVLTIFLMIATAIVTYSYYKNNGIEGVKELLKEFITTFILVSLSIVFINSFINVAYRFKTVKVILVVIIVLKIKRILNTKE